ncbi:IS66 family transposase [Legionella gratiana]|uniref:IS66 family transposase n=1 Tax=Legionella gratiana TaxID=45066 RepID=UPI001EE75928|nr:transposase [Legionella gratiana]
MLKHWEKLTHFLQIPGAPIHNNDLERGLKIPIRGRRLNNNSVFSHARLPKTRNGFKMRTSLSPGIYNELTSGLYE